MDRLAELSKIRMQYSRFPINRTLANLNQNQFHLDFRHTFIAVLPSVTRSLEPSNPPLTRGNFRLSSDNFLPASNRVWIIANKCKIILIRNVYVYFFFGQKGGKPQAVGSNSSSESRTKWACEHFDLSTLLSGTMTTFIPAARAAVTPFGASSSTSTSRGEVGGAWNLAAANWKISGAGLECFSSGSSDFTVCEKSWKRSLWFDVLILYSDALDPVATAMGILCLWRWRTSFSTPTGK